MIFNLFNQHNGELKFVRQINAKNSQAAIKLGKVYAPHPAVITPADQTHIDERTDEEVWNFDPDRGWTVKIMPRGWFDRPRAPKRIH